MRAKFFSLASVVGLSLLALSGVLSAAQAHEGYRNYRVEHRDYNRGHRDRDRGEHYRDHDSR